MPEANPMVIGAVVVLGGLLLLPFGDAPAKLFIIVAGTLVLAYGFAQGVRRRRKAPGRQSG